MNFIELMNWRYSVKHFSNQKVSSEKIDTILEAIRLAPTSMGLQAMKVLLIEDEKILKEISEKSCTQPQIKECSHLILLAAREDMTDKELNDFIQRHIDTRNVSEESLSGLKTMVSGVQSKDKSEFLEWSLQQTYIVLGIALAAAASEKVDATPMKGFNPQAMDEIMNLKDKGLTSSLLIALGYRDEENDKLANSPKVRKTKEEFIEIV
ncbi:MAG: NAD(P)H-dependent oxidoreductase [Chlorobi bacterium]|nr:NAD(P)H-dependent oxidoreductase [Chlorobiota bacterium]